MISLVNVGSTIHSSKGILIQSHLSRQGSNEKNNVATAIMPLIPDQTVPLKIHGRTENITIQSFLPQGHKCALREIEKGADVYPSP
jgi:hypothetical protein